MNFCFNEMYYSYKCINYNESIEITNKNIYKKTKKGNFLFLPFLNFVDSEDSVFITICTRKENKLNSLKNQIKMHILTSQHRQTKHNSCMCMHAMPINTLPTKLPFHLFGSFINMYIYKTKV